MDVTTLVAAMPGLPSDKAQRCLAPMEAAMHEFGITTELRARMWLAQVGHESGSLRYFEEIASGAAYEGRRDLGNTRPGDGVRYKGRGPIQLTGRANYVEAGKALNLPLVSSPEKAADPQYAFRISAWWWKTHGLNEIADVADVVRATKRINGGTNGLSDRQQRYALARELAAKVVPGPPPKPLNPGEAPPFKGELKLGSKGENVALWQDKMVARGHDLTVDGDYGPKSEARCKVLQTNQHLPVTGVVDAVTWATTWK
jgi:putative chitinase